jgi:dihydroflavonol-4-reductase
VALAVVTGATGLLGSNLALELLAQGHRVRATRRGTSQVDFLDGHAIEWVPGELSDEEALTEAFRGADVVFHCAAAVTVRRVPTKETIATNVEGTRHVVGAVRAAGVKRLVHCSSVVAVGISEDGTPCTEEARWNLPEHGLADGYAVTKRESELLVHAAAQDGLDAVIVNPTFMIGPYDARLSSGKLVKAVLERQVPGQVPGFNNFVDVRDVAKGMVLAWQKGKAGERYILSGYNLTYPEIGALISKVGGTKPITRTLPRWVAEVAGRVGDVAELVLTSREPLVNRCTIAWAFCRGFQFSSEKAKRELGYQLSPLEPAVRDCIAWLRGRGVVR